jgi:hypothetical protein
MPADAAARNGLFVQTHRSQDSLYGGSGSDVIEAGDDSEPTA